MNNMIDTSIALNKAPAGKQKFQYDKSADRSNVDFENVLNKELNAKLKNDSDVDATTTEKDIMNILTDTDENFKQNKDDILSALYQIFSGSANSNIEINDLVKDINSKSDLSDLVNQISDIDSSNSNSALLSNLILQAKAKADGSKIDLDTTNSDAKNTVESTGNIERGNTSIDKSTDGLYKVFDEISKKFPNGVSEDFAKTRASYEMTRNRIQNIRSMAKGKTSNLANESNKLVENKTSDKTSSELISNESMNKNIEIVDNGNLADLKVQVLEDNSVKKTDKNQFKESLEKDIKIDESTSKSNLDMTEKVTRKNSKEDSSDNSTLNNSNEQKFNLSGKMAEISKFVADKETKPIDYGKSIINQVKDQITIVKSSGLKEGVNEVKMKLKPENLGELNIKITLEKGNLSIDILAENSKTQNLILNNIDQLKNALKENVNNNYVNVENERQDLEQENQNSGQNRRNSNFYFVDEEEDKEMDFLDQLIKMNEFNLKRL